MSFKETSELPPILLVKNNLIFVDEHFVREMEGENSLNLPGLLSI